MNAGRGNTFIVDDEADMRLLLLLTINGDHGALRVIGEASSGEQALALVPTLDVDVVVLDQRMPGLTGLETAKALLATEEGLPIVLYSAFVDENMADQARQIGVRRCVKKGDVTSLLRALHDLTGADA